MSTSAGAAVDTVGPTIGMQRTGHLIVGAAVTHWPGFGLFNESNNQVFETTAQVRWTVTDPSGVCDSQVYSESLHAGGVYLLADVGKATTYNVPTGDASEADGGYNVRAIIIRSMDCAGNWTTSSTSCLCDPAEWPFPITDRAENLPDNMNYLVSHDDNAATYSNPTGIWTHSTGAVFMGGSNIHATKAGASVTYTYEGATFAWVSELGPSRGSAKVYQDGVLKGTVNLTAKVNSGPQVVWSNYFPTSGVHTIQIVVVGTAGHPRVDVDGFFTGPTGF